MNSPWRLAPLTTLILAACAADSTSIDAGAADAELVLDAARPDAGRVTRPDTGPRPDTGAPEDGGASSCIACSSLLSGAGPGGPGGPGGGPGGFNFCAGSDTKLMGMFGCLCTAGNSCASACAGICALVGGGGMMPPPGDGGMMGMPDLTGCFTCAGMAGGMCEAEVTACRNDQGGGGPVQNEVANATWATGVAPALARRCGTAGCHLGAQASSGLVLGPASESLRLSLVGVRSQTSTLALVEPGRPLGSFLFRKVLGDQGTLMCNPAGCGARMPLGGAPWGTADLATFGQWIAEGARGD